jgi:hypothetical protein
MLKREAANVVVSTDGYSVSRINRFQIAYIEEHRSCYIEIEWSPGRYSIYRDSVTGWQATQWANPRSPEERFAVERLSMELEQKDPGRWRSGDASMTAAERELILRRVVEAMQFMVGPEYQVVVEDSQVIDINNGYPVELNSVKLPFELIDPPCAHGVRHPAGYLIRFLSFSVLEYRYGAQSCEITFHMEESYRRSEFVLSRRSLEQPKQGSLPEQQIVHHIDQAFNAMGLDHRWE